MKMFALKWGMKKFRQQLLGTERGKNLDFDDHVISLC